MSWTRRIQEHLTFRQAKRLVILIFGLSVLLVGIAMVVLPGPAFIVIPAGLSILAIEFAWARRWLQHFKKAVDSARKRFGNGKRGQTSDSARGDDSAP